jgi:2,3-bisphosphoglycerate-independent phosphoglycerate mutase
MPKAILVVMDGPGDRHVKELGASPPLEAAHTPNQLD